MIGFVEFAAGAAAGTVVVTEGIETIKNITHGCKDIAHNCKETYNISKDLPMFSRNTKPEIVSDFNDADKPLYLNESKEKTGGSYGEVFKEGMGDKYEVHHMPADNVNGLERTDGPAIRMDKEDHRQTASCGNSIEAREYRAHQKELIDQGKFREALEMDIEDIRDKFGDKYDESISQMLEYTNKLDAEGKI